jgi:hypothetical protein
MIWSWFDWDADCDIHLQYEPIITPGNENHVHHVLAYNCPTATDADVGSVFNCYGRRPKNLEGCSDVVIAWAVGGVVS